ncbi:MAG TPA: hypothetical protein VK540_13230 [Polyangiaceae bacterium]|jgi:hypothetical protein|nr:hypothetical protein [Polyangiaceae bacterium]
MSRRSIRPKPRAAVEQLDDLFRTLGKPDPALIAALLDGTSEQQLLARADAAPASPDLIQSAAATIGRAFEYWQRLAGEKRKMLRGCSQHLFAVAVDQTRTLQHLHQQHLQRIAEEEEAKVQQRAALDKAKHVCNQTKGIVMKVAGGRPSIQVTLDEKVADSSTPYGMICNLKFLADTSRSLLQLPGANIRGRATLYGMDKSFIESLDTMAEEIRVQEEKANVRPSKLPGHQSAARTRAVVFFLMNHLVDVFEAARQIDPATPELRKAEAAPSGMTSVARPIVAAAPAVRALPQRLEIPRVK